MSDSKKSDFIASQKGENSEGTNITNLLSCSSGNQFFRNIVCCDPLEPVGYLKKSRKEVRFISSSEQSNSPSPLLGIVSSIYFRYVPQRGRVNGYCWVLTILLGTP